MAVPLSDRSAKVWLYHLKRLQGEGGRLSSNVSREICSISDLLLLVQVTDTF